MSNEKLGAEQGEEEIAMNPKVSLILVTTEFRGDHSAEVTVACELHEGETVPQLAERILVDGTYSTRFADRIEIRLVRP